MSDSEQQSPNRTDRGAPAPGGAPNRARRPPHQSNNRNKGGVAGVAVAELREWIEQTAHTEGPTYAAKVHINGANHPTAFLSVDYGMRGRPVRLTADQTQDLIGRMRRAAYEIAGERDCNIRVSCDTANNIWWAAVS